MDPYATHLHATVATALQTGILEPGSVIVECGCGDYSTPVLQEIAIAQSREYYGFSTDREWSSRYDGIEVLDSWDNFRGLKAGFVLMDNEEITFTRFERLQLFQDSTVVFHDAHDRLDFSSAPFEYHTILKTHVPWTAVLSNKHDVRGWF